MTAPLVIWMLGSDSDLPQVEDGFDALKELEIPYEVRILSAHRTPKAVEEVVSGAKARGTKVMIGVAGGAAHLPGVIASHTTLPVIGVPIVTTMSGGLDSLLSIVQMPGGIPVATVAAGKSGGRNAALLAAQIIGTSDERVSAALVGMREAMKTKVLARDKDKGTRLSDD
jgi:phosphoribosylaminoimidazole carboxylase PurE protein